MTTSDIVIKVDKLNKSFNGTTVLRDISLEVRAGQKLCIIGPSGSGKSTLLRCINLLETPDSGELWVAGSPLSIGSAAGSAGGRVRESEINQHRATVGMVFQSFNLWGHMTVLHNIIEAPMRVRKLDRAAAINQALALLERIGLSGKKNAYPSELSGGQQQRVAIARALAMEPKVMLFDEPTSALDPELVSEVLDVITSLANDGMTMLIVTHEMGFAAEVADRILFMDHGSILDDIPPREFFHRSSSDRAGQFLAKVIGRNNALANLSPNQ